MTLPELSAALEKATRDCPANKRHLGNNKCPQCGVGPDSTCPRQDAASRLLLGAFQDAYRTGQLVERDGVAGVVEALEGAREYIANAPQTGPTGIRAIDSRSRAFQELGPHILVAKIEAALTAIKGGEDAD